jgi:hypothetical protein
VGHWKLKVSGAAGQAGPQVELFNLADDIGESRNLAETEPGRVAGLRERYQRWADQAVPPKNQPGG